MNTTTETKVPSPEMEVATEAPTANLVAQIAQLKTQEPARDDHGNPIRKHGHTATADFGEVVGAISAVMMDMTPVGKGGTNTFHNYKYARMQDILQMLTPLMGKHGIVVFQYENARNMFDDGKVIAITYDFIVAHKSGQTWINPVPQTGMSPCRTSKGTFDDKAFAKCHTSARKYFLLSLFQVPTEDEADPDNERAPRSANTPVPGPTGYTPPHYIEPTRGETSKSWADKYERSISLAKSAAELTDWDNLNDGLLTTLSEKDPERYDKLMQTVAALTKAFIPTSEPTAKTDIPPPAAQETSQKSLEAKVGNVPPVLPDDCPSPGKDPDKFLNFMADYLSRPQTSDEFDAARGVASSLIQSLSFPPDREELQGLIRRNEHRFEG